MNLSRSCLIEYPTYCAPQFFVFACDQVYYVSGHAVVVLVWFGWGYWGFGCFCCAVGKGFSFHFRTVIAFVITSFDGVSIILGGMFE